MGEHKACAKTYYKINTTFTLNNNTNKTIYSLNKTLYPFEKGNYCEPDYEAGNYKVCDIIVYSNGTNETGGCTYYNDLVMHWKCRDIGNATVIKNIEIK